MTSSVEETSFAIFIVYTVTALRGPKCGPKLIVPDPGQAKDENKLHTKIYIYISFHTFLFCLFTESVAELGLERQRKGQ